jgi:hypothetical protein
MQLNFRGEVCLEFRSPGISAQDVGEFPEMKVWYDQPNLAV